MNVPINFLRSFNVFWLIKTLILITELLDKVNNHKKLLKRRTLKRPLFEFQLNFYATDKTAILLRNSKISDFSLKLPHALLFFVSIFILREKFLNLSVFDVQKNEKLRVKLRIQNDKSSHNKRSYEKNHT